MDIGTTCEGGGTAVSRIKGGWLVCDKRDRGAIATEKREIKFLSSDTVFEYFSVVYEFLYRR